jgi:hypothetical protein
MEFDIPPAHAHGRRATRRVTPANMRTRRATATATAATVRLARRPEDDKYIAEDYITRVYVIKKALQQLGNQYKLLIMQEQTPAQAEAQLQPTYKDIIKSWPYYDANDNLLEPDIDAEYPAGANPSPSANMIKKYIGLLACKNIIKTALLARRKFNDRRRFEGLVPMINGATDAHTFRELVKKYITASRAPFLPARANTIAATRPQGLAYEIHNAFFKIDMVKYMEIIESEITKDKREYKASVLTYIQLKLNQKIKQIFNGDEQAKKVSEFNKVFAQLTENVQGEKEAEEEYLYLNQFNGRKNLVKKVVLGKSADYVLKQSPEFIELYINSLLQDCLHAYAGAHGMSCVPGIIERFIMLIGDTLYIQCIERSKCSADQLQLLDIFNFKIDINELCNQYIEEWIAEWNEKIEAWKALGQEGRKENFIESLRDKYKAKNIYDNPTYHDLIEALIQKNATDLSYIFENEEEVMIGGGGRKKKQTRKQTRKHKRSQHKHQTRRKYKHCNYKPKRKTHKYKVK